MLYIQLLTCTKMVLTYYLNFWISRNFHLKIYNKLEKHWLLRIPNFYNLIIFHQLLLLNELWVINYVEQVHRVFLFIRIFLTIGDGKDQLDNIRNDLWIRKRNLFTAKKMFMGSCAWGDICSEMGGLTCL